MADLGQARALRSPAQAVSARPPPGRLVVDRWPRRPSSGIPFDLAFNDQLENLLFALGRFLHTHGASTLWHQLIADGGRIKDAGLATGLVLSDLARLANQPLLALTNSIFCVPSHLDEPNAQHMRILEFSGQLAR